MPKIGYQPVNGGIDGTGFSIWLKLDRTLSAADIQVKKIVILFISYDYRASPGILYPESFGAFRTYRCARSRRVSFFRYRLPTPDEMSAWAAKIRRGRVATLRARANALLPVTYRAYEFGKELFQRSPQTVRDERGEEESRSAIGQLINIYGAENVAFIHLPTKEELDRGPNELGSKARHAIEQAGGRLVDGFRLCGLRPDDYYPRELHPNTQGYAKIAKCTMDVIRRMPLQDPRPR